MNACFSVWKEHCRSIRLTDFYRFTMCSMYESYESIVVMIDSKSGAVQQRVSSLEWLRETETESIEKPVQN